MRGTEADQLVHRLARGDWRSADLGEADRALCAFAEKLTHTPGDMSQDDLATLRRHGFSDRALHDAAQIVGLFAYYNRVVDALGLEPETFIRPWELSPEPLPDATPDPPATSPDPVAEEKA